MKRLILTVCSLVLIAGAGVVTFALLRAFDTKSTETAKPLPATPSLSATRVMEGLNHPWDIDFLPSGTLVFTEREGTLSKIVDGKKVSIGSPDDINSEGEGGLMGVAIDSNFQENRYVYTCYNSVIGDVRVVRWVLNNDEDELAMPRPIITGIQAAETGRHSGCQIVFGPDEVLWVGTGDAADETEPQNRDSLGGKILRVTRDGEAASGNPDGPDKRVFSYGHRNIQGIALYSKSRDGSYGVSVEHGSDRDDEVNELKPGNFGWDPGAGYDENVAMTDVNKFPDAIERIWTSGSPTIAPSGAAFLRGESWGRLEGWLAMSVLKDQKLLLLNLAGGSLKGQQVRLDNEFGRLRAATLGPDGALYVSTDNGMNDSILRIIAS